MGILLQCNLLIVKYFLYLYKLFLNKCNVFLYRIYFLLVLGVILMLICVKFIELNLNLELSLNESWMIDFFIIIGVGFG